MPVSRLSMTCGHRSDRKAHDRTAGHLRFDHHTGHALGLARDDDEIDAAVDPLDVVTMAEQRHERLQPALGNSLLDAASEADRRPRSPGARRSHRVAARRARRPRPRAASARPDDRRSRRGTLPRRRRARRAGVQTRRRDPRLSNRAGLRAFGIIHTGPRYARRSISRSSSAADHDRGVEAVARWRASTSRATRATHARECRVSAATPSRPWRSPQAERGDLCGRAAVRDDDVGRRCRQLLPEPPATSKHRDGSDRSRMHERWKPRVDIAVECERQRDHLVVVPERVELVRELDRHDLGSTPVRSRDDVHDAHRAMVARLVNHSVNSGRRRAEPIATLSPGDGTVRTDRGRLRLADHHARPARTGRGVDQYERLGGGGGARAREGMGGHAARRPRCRDGARASGAPGAGGSDGLEFRAVGPCFVRRR